MRIGDLKLPFGAVTGASGSGASSVPGGSSAKRQRAISAPSPVTPSFFNNFSNPVGAAAGGSGHNVVDEHNHQEQLAAAAAPFGVPASSGSNHQQHYNTTTYGSHLQPYAFPSVFNPPIQNPVPKYEFPAYNTGRSAGTSSNHPFGHTRHTIPAMPSLMADNGPLNSSGSESTFALETPRTIYSAANATARPGTANSINNGPNTSISPGENKPDVNTLEQSMTQMQNAKNTDLLTAGGNSVGSGNDENSKNVEGGKKEEVTPGPTPAYVFPATQKGSNEPGQTRRVFVNPPPGTTSTIAAAGTHSPGQTNQHLLIPQPQARLQQDVAQGHNVTHTSHTMPNSNLPVVPDHNSSSNPFDVIQNYNDDDAKNRPSPLSINSSSNTKNTFPSLPSATSPTRHLNSEYGDMFSTAPFGLCFDAPSGKSTSTAVRRSSLFNGLTAR